jgi:hypothetical protein
VAYSGSALTGSDGLFEFRIPSACNRITGDHMVLFVSLMELYTASLGRKRRAIPRQNDSPSSQRPSAKPIPSLSVHLPDIHPNKVPFVKDKRPNMLVLPPVAKAPSLNMSRPSANTTNPIL